jgi:hypothetical protein
VTSVRNTVHAVGCASGSGLSILSVDVKPPLLVRVRVCKLLLSVCVCMRVCVALSYATSHAGRSAREFRCRARRRSAAGVQRGVVWCARKRSDMADAQFVAGGFEQQKSSRVRAPPAQFLRVFDTKSAHWLKAVRGKPVPPAPPPRYAHSLTAIGGRKLVSRM